MSGNLKMMGLLQGAVLLVQWLGGLLGFWPTDWVWNTAAVFGIAVTFGICFAAALDRFQRRYKIKKRKPAKSE